MTIEKSLPNMVMVCVDGVENGDIYGRYFHRYEKEETFFPDSATLIIEMERFYDDIGYPQAAIKTRKFIERKGGRIPAKEHMAVISDSQTFDAVPWKAGNISCRCNFQTKCELAGRCGLDGAEDPEAFLQRHGSDGIRG